jgi:hypothetical protein
MMAVALKTRWRSMCRHLAMRRGPQKAKESLTARVAETRRKLPAWQSQGGGYAGPKLNTPSPQIITAQPSRPSV